jgi:copper(I)-binding protein
MARRLPAAKAVVHCMLLPGVALAGGLASGAAAPAEQMLRISDPWMRFIMPSHPAAGYFTLSNATSEPRTLVGATSPADAAPDGSRERGG